MTSEELTAIGDVMETKLDSFRKDAFVPFRIDMKDHVATLHTELSKHTEILANHGARLVDVEASAAYAEKIAKGAADKATTATKTADDAGEKAEGVETEVVSAKNQILKVGLAGLGALILFLIKEAWAFFTTGKTSG